MFAKILQPAKSAMQSGTKPSCWMIEFERLPDSIFIDPKMGWHGTIDTRQEIKLYFETLEQAKEYAERNEVKYEVIQPKSRKQIKKSYADNFK